MYIEKLFDENVGPIEKIKIDFPYNNDGMPRPIVFVGENGSGKSTLLSNIVDSLYSIAEVGFNNVMQSSDSGKGYQYYKVISPTEIKTGKDYLFSYIVFKNNPPIKYIFKSGNLTIVDFKKKVPNSDTIDFSWDGEDNYKEVGIDKKAVENIFETDVICYFGPDRYEKPMWMGEKYFEISDDLHPSVQAKMSGVLRNPISVKNVTETSLQWLMDIIVDSRPDVEEYSDGLRITHVDSISLSVMRTARKNLETILSQILGKRVYFSLNFRNRGASRFKIIEYNTNNIIAPTLDSLSAGQIALFNMFSTIVRYADNNNLNNSVALNDITGIVVIDEIELHLHTSLQKEVLPKLIKLFPKVQFIITSHAPLFLLGMQEEFGEDGFEIYEMPLATRISVERFSEFRLAYEYFKKTQLYQSDAKAAIQKAMDALTSKVLVITEGATDWKHMKTALVTLKSSGMYDELFCNLDFDFLEYEPSNSDGAGGYKLEMGNATLTSICESYAKLPHDTTYIFIADRDDNTTNRKLGSTTGRYKKWSNNVYSFLLPVPETRKETPNISIEHLFSDNEIKTEIPCNDGVVRRLYLGNEFNQHGHSMSLNLFCERRGICGPDKINIIEGSQGDKIYRFDDTTEKNYALSKMKFAKYVSENPERFDFKNFVEIFSTIKEILESVKTTCQSNQ